MPSFSRVTDRALRRALLSMGFRSTRVATSAGTVHAVTAEGRGPADAPPIVLLHGLSSTGMHYVRLMRHLLARSPLVVAPDLPGHGLTDVTADRLSVQGMRDTLIEALHVLVDRPAIVFGNSLGGFAAFHYAEAHPDRVAGLILCSPAGAPSSPGEVAALRSMLSPGTHGDALEFVDRVMTASRPMRQLLAWGTRQRFATQAHRDIVSQVSDDLSLLPAQLAAVAMPTLVMWGTEDRVLPPRQFDYFKAHLPHAAIERLQGLGHSPYLERPAVVARRILAFAQRVVDGSAPRPPDLAAVGVPWQARRA